MKKRKRKKVGSYKIKEENIVKLNKYYDKITNKWKEYQA